MPEEILVRQGAPTLAGIKTGSLFPCPCEDKEALFADIRRLNRLLVPKGLCLLPIRFLKGQVLLSLYRPSELRRDLEDEQAAEILHHAGYNSGHCGRCIANLIRRFREGGEFPHEVGLFLSYPPRTSRASSTTAPATSNARGCGRFTATRRRRASCSPASKNARRSTAHSGRPARASSSLPWQCDRY